jgi:hypothetical protein
VILEIASYYLLASVIVLTSIRLLLRHLITSNDEWVLGQIDTYLLLNLGTISFLMPIALFFHDAITGIGCTAIFTYLMQQLMVSAKDVLFLDTVLRFYPPYLQTDFTGWTYYLHTKNPTWLILVSVGCIIISIAISTVIVYRRELKLRVSND